MKRAKVILSAVALLAVVGGALAFKATRTTTDWYTTNAAGNCVVTTPINYQTTTLGAQDPTPIVQSIYNSLPHAGLCTTTTVFRAF